MAVFYNRRPPDQGKPGDIVLPVAMGAWPVTMGHAPKPPPRPVGPALHLAAAPAVPPFLAPALLTLASRATILKATAPLVEELSA